MMKKYSLLSVLSIFLFTLQPVHAYRYDMHLKGGISQSYGKIKGLEDSEDLSHGTGFNTHFGYKSKYFEFNLSSYIHWGEMEDLRFRSRGEEITGEGQWRNVSFGPTVKYQFRGVQPVKNWFMYLSTGPMWSLQTVKFDEFESTGPLFNADQKLTYESYGGSFSIGFEEDLPYKEMHQVFIELNYSYMKTYKVRSVDKSDFSEINILSEEESKQDFSGHFLTVSLGMTIF